MAHEDHSRLLLKALAALPQQLSGLLGAMAFLKAPQLVSALAPQERLRSKQCLA